MEYSSNATDLSSLIALGFDPSLSAQALAHCSTLEQAHIHLKMVLIVRTDLGMTPGKIAAQCVHAALGAYRYVNQTDQNLANIWEMTGEKAVCLKVKSEEELMQLEKSAKENNLPHYLVCDAGRTQIDPGSKTVLAIGPATEDKINIITGKLKLY